MQSIFLLILLLLFLFLLLSTQSCKQATEPRLEPELALKLEDVSCTEAWIQLTTTNLQLPATINVLKNNTVTQTFSLSTQDTLLYIDSLLPNQTYKIKVSSIQYPASPEETSSNELSITTMDTTSHNFTWQSWEFGECSNSVLYDVAIIDENNIWAVGEIYMRDSLGNCDPNAYNAVHWDGTKWELKRIYHYSSCNPVDYPPFKSIVAFSDTEIVLTSGGSIGWFNGKMNRTDCGIRPLLTGSINKLWGSSSNDLYAVGNNGNIAHWDGRKWTKIESGTDIDLLDVSGNNNELFISGHSLDQSKSILLKFSTGQIKLVWYNNTNNTEPYGRIIYSSKLIGKNLFTVSNRGVYLQNVANNSQVKLLFPILYRAYRLTGTNSNDVYIVGSRSNIQHYNGVSSKEVYIDLISTVPLYSADSKSNIIVAVGKKVENAIYHKAIIRLGKRN
ncbi:MAG: glucosyl transferase [Ignavibacterium sp.]|nr:glucosyl transferase [Ignavibacterium sp.]